MLIHGVEPAISSDENSKPVEKFDENQKKAFDIALQKAKERKRLEFANKKG